MFNKVKSAFYNVVGSFDSGEGGTVGNLGIVSLASGVQSISTVTRQNIVQGKEKTLKFPYTRPHFLQFSTEDEILVTADHAIRPIICPRDISRQPWNSGYAETINAGKSKRNEDQAAVHVGLLTRCVSRSTVPSSKQKNHIKDRKRASVVNGVVDENSKSKDSKVSTEEGKGLLNSSTKFQVDNSAQSTSDKAGPNSVKDQSSQERGEAHQFIVSLPYYYFGVFDGHAGWGAAVSAANQLHQIIHEKLCDVIDYIIPDIDQDSPTTTEGSGLVYYSFDKSVSPESVIIGALERAFWAMDQIISEDRLKHQLSGGCTACIALFILGKVFVSNAGDSRAVIGFNDIPVPMSFDFTPETETQRIRKLGARHPELLGGEFTHLEYVRRPLKRDLGKKALFRDHYMKGWALKTIKEDDLKYPLVCGEGKRSRVLATIGVTRGFGDHDLKAQFSSLPIKPFLSPEPEVRVFDLSEGSVSNKDVLILGTDGLWDIVSNEKAVSVVTNSLEQFPPGDSHRWKYRYTSAAHDLVLYARGRLKDHNWRTGEDKHATIDDISVFVIPLKPYKEEFDEWQREAKLAVSELCETGVEATAVESSFVITKQLSNTNTSTETLPTLPPKILSDSASQCSDIKNVASESGGIHSIPSSGIDSPALPQLLNDSKDCDMKILKRSSDITEKYIGTNNSPLPTSSRSETDYDPNLGEKEVENNDRLNPVDDYYENGKDNDK